MIVARISQKFVDFLKNRYLGIGHQNDCFNSITVVPQLVTMVDNFGQDAFNKINNTRHVFRLHNGPHAFFCFPLLIYLLDIFKTHEINENVFTGGCQ